jgi:hypothetical protein
LLYEDTENFAIPVIRGNNYKGAGENSCRMNGPALTRAVPAVMQSGYMHEFMSLQRYMP